MFVGHYAVGFAAKRIEPRFSLFTLLTAAMLADNLYSIFLIAGIEHVAISPGITRVNALDLYDFPISHSLLTDVIWAARAAWIIVAAVLSHWLLDFISHRPDMPLALRVHKYFGLGLWNSIPPSAIVEGAMWFAAIILYAPATRAKGRAGFYGLWIPIGVLTLRWATGLNGAPPPRIVKIVNVVLISLTLAWTYWLDRARVATALESATASQARGAFR